MTQPTHERRRLRSAVAASLALTMATAAVYAQAAQAARGQAPVTAQKPNPLDKPGALAKDNLAKARPKPPFDLTGNWMYDPGRNTFGYLPLPKLKPAAQASYEAAQRAQAEGKAYKNDEGTCWPAGMPQMMTRMWPNQTIQLPTMIVMIQNSHRRKVPNSERHDGSHVPTSVVKYDEVCTRLCYRPHHSGPSQHSCISWQDNNLAAAVMYLFLQP